MKSWDHQPWQQALVAGPGSRPWQQTQDGNLAWKLNKLDSRWFSSTSATQARVRPSANSDTVGLADLLAASELRGASEIHLHNFMIDLDWMCEEAPALSEFRGKLIVFHGDDAAPCSKFAQANTCELTCLSPPVEQYGSYHSKVRVGSEAY